MNQNVQINENYKFIDPKITTNQKQCKKKKITLENIKIKLLKTSHVKKKIFKVARQKTC